MKRKPRKIIKYLLIILIIVFIISIITPIFYQEHLLRPPLFMFDDLYPYIEKHELPEDLTDLEIWKNKIESCPPSKYAPPGKCLIIYNPNYEKDKKDWVVMIGYDFKTTNYMRCPIIIYNNNDAGVAINKKEVRDKIFSNRTGLKYYYFTEEN